MNKKMKPTLRRSPSHALMAAGAVCAAALAGPAPAQTALAAAVASASAEMAAALEAWNRLVPR